MKRVSPRRVRLVEGAFPSGATTGILASEPFNADENDPTEFSVLVVVGDAVYQVLVDEVEELI